VNQSDKGSGERRELPSEVRGEAFSAYSRPQNASHRKKCYILPKVSAARLLLQQYFCHCPVLLRGGGGATATTARPLATPLGHECSLYCAANEVANVAGSSPRCMLYNCFLLALIRTNCYQAYSRAPVPYYGMCRPMCTVKACSSAPICAGVAQKSSYIGRPLSQTLVLLCSCQMLSCFQIPVIIRFTAGLRPN